MLWYHVLIFFLLLTTLGYGVMLLLAARALRALSGQKIPPVAMPSAETGFSIVVAFRNEAVNLPALLQDLQQQEGSLPPHEVIWVNDHSDDDSMAVLERSSGTNHHVLSLADSAGKKAALGLGIETARYPVVITLDADCRLQAEWLYSLAASWNHQNPDMLILPLALTSDGGALQAFQRFEHRAVQGLTFGLAYMGYPVLCNGANLAFSKKAFLEAGGYNDHKEHASGDDVFLLHRFKSLGKNIATCWSKDVLASTHPAGDLGSFLKQRLRWAGKSQAYRDADTIASGFVLVLPSLCWLAALLAGVNAVWLVAALIARVIADVVLIKNTAPVLGASANVWKLALFSVGYMVYSPVMALMSLLVKPTWKGRKI